MTLQQSFSSIHMIVSYLGVIFAILFNNYFTVHNHPINNTYIYNINYINITTSFRADKYYAMNVMKLCPDELTNNEAGHEGLFFNTSNKRIKRSITKKYFHHCGAWCLFDYDDPRKGWYWNNITRDWVYYTQLYNFCPDNEFHYAINKYFNENLLKRD